MIKWDNVCKHTAQCLAWNKSTITIIIVITISMIALPKQQILAIADIPNITSE